jgi:hypothetical protein
MQKAGKIGVNGTFAEMLSWKIYPMGLAYILLSVGKTRVMTLKTILSELDIVDLKFRQPMLCFFEGKNLLQLFLDYSHLRCDRWKP